VYYDDIAMSNNPIDELLDAMFRAAKMQFGPAARSMFMYREKDCPGCSGKMKPAKSKGKDLLSLNTFFYREHGVIIAYMLCGKCAKLAIKLSEATHPGTTPLHQEIEKNLKNTFLKKTGH
jgi:hypothetical protein